MHHVHSKNILCPAGRATAFVSGPAAPSMSIFDEVLGGGRKISAFAFTLLTCMERNTYTDRQANNPFLQYFLFHSTGMADGVAAAISLLAPRHDGHHPKPSPTKQLAGPKPPRLTRAMALPHLGIAFLNQEFGDRPYGTRCLME